MKSIFYQWWAKLFTKSPQAIHNCIVHNCKIEAKLFYRACGNISWDVYSPEKKYWGRIQAQGSDETGKWKFQIWKQDCGDRWNGESSGIAHRNTLKEAIQVCESSYAGKNFARCDDACPDNKRDLVRDFYNKHGHSPAGDSVWVHWSLAAEIGDNPLPKDFIKRAQALHDKEIEQKEKERLNHNSMLEHNLYPSEILDDIMQSDHVGKTITEFWPEVQPQSVLIGNIAPGESVSVVFPVQ